jgi:hypothetical protein
LATLTDLVSRAKADVHRVQVRREAEASARQLLDSSAGEMTEQQFRDFFRLLSTDFHNGKPAYGRFAPGFVGQYVNNLVANLEILNEWTATLWRGSDEAVLDALRRLLADRKLLPAARPRHDSHERHLDRRWGLGRMADQFQEYEHRNAAAHRRSDLREGGWIGRQIDLGAGPPLSLEPERAFV